MLYVPPISTELVIRSVLFQLKSAAFASMKDSDA